jgi:hypothetical protein
MLVSREGHEHAVWLMKDQFVDRPIRIVERKLRDVLAHRLRTIQAIQLERR